MCELTVTRYGKVFDVIIAFAKAVTVSEASYPITARLSLYLSPFEGIGQLTSAILPRHGTLARLFDYLARFMPWGALMAVAQAIRPVSDT